MKYRHDKLRMNWAGHVASMDRQAAYRALVGKTLRKETNQKTQAETG